MTPQGVVVDLLTNENDLVFTLTDPITVVNGEAFPGEVKDVASFTFVEPQDPLGPEDLSRHLVV